jgi:glycosyltransferase involved in cell wall biosynthesis
MASRTKVAIISPNQGVYGGLEAYVLALSRFLSKRHDIEVRLVFKKVKGFKLSEGLQAMLRQSSIQAEFVDRGSRRLARVVFWADVVHAQNASPDVVLLAKVLFRPVVITIHFNFLMPFSLRKAIWYFTARIAERRLYVSDFVLRTWEGRSKRPNSLMVHSICELPNGQVPSLERSGFSFMGRWVENKGVDVLVNAYQQAGFDKEIWPLRLIGTGPLEPKISQQIKGAGDRHIDLLGFVSDERKSEVIRNSKWVVVPPHTNEDLGLVPFEARSAGVPCIASRDGGLPEAAGREALFCVPGSIDSLREALERAAAMSEEEYLGRSYRTKAELHEQLTPMEFYPDLYRSLEKGRVHGT